MTKQQVIDIHEAYKPNDNIYNEYNSIEEKVDMKMNDYIKEQNEAFSDDLISRQAAIEEIEPYTDDIYNSTAIEIKEILQRLPSVQPKRKTGRWIYMKDCEDWFCSNCKDIFMLLEGTPKDNDYNYCPNCGAYMKGENNERDTF